MLGPKSEEEENVIGEENHFFTPDDMPIYITEGEEYSRSTPRIQLNEGMKILFWQMRQFFRKSLMNTKEDT